ncbi:hypothetical protein ACOME3_008522 [Neoechinorhynchus agilis]
MSDDLGFRVLIDKLRIPSTRAKCIIGLVNDHARSGDDIRSIYLKYGGSMSDQMFTDKKRSSQNHVKLEDTEGLLRKVVRLVIDNETLSLADIYKHMDKKDLLIMTKSSGGIKSIIKQSGYFDLKANLVSISDKCNVRKRICLFSDSECPVLKLKGYCMRTHVNSK